MDATFRVSKSKSKSDSQSLPRLHSRSNMSVSSNDSVSHRFIQSHSVSSDSRLPQTHQTNSVTKSPKQSISAADQSSSITANQSERSKSKSNNLDRTFTRMPKILPKQLSQSMSSNEEPKSDISLLKTPRIGDINSYSGTSRAKRSTRVETDMDLSKTIPRTKSKSVKYMHQVNKDKKQREENSRRRKSDNRQPDGQIVIIQNKEMHHRSQTLPLITGIHQNGMLCNQ